MGTLKLTVAKMPVVGRLLLIFFRATIPLRYLSKVVRNIVVWIFSSNETTNLTYDLEEDNKRYLASLIADVIGIEYKDAFSYIKEIEDDAQLKEHISEVTRRSGLAYMADKEARFGRRVGWYAFARALKPKVVFETGVDKGMGSCILAAALKKNSAEGCEGRYYGTDINPRAGYLLSSEYANFGSILHGDSIESLKKFEGRIDLFINDSDHSAEYEAAEYRTITDKLSENAVILGDNSHCTDKLLEFSIKTGRHFVYFQERPFGHWYPGGGIGISFRRRQDTAAS